MAEQPDASLPNVMKAAAGNAAATLRTDARLFAAEMGDSLARIERLAVWAAIGILCVIIAVCYVFQAVFYVLLRLGLQPHFASLTIAVIAALGAVSCLMAAKRAVSSLSLIPTQTMGAIRKDIAALKGAWVSVNK